MDMTHVLSRNKFDLSCHKILAVITLGKVAFKNILLYTLILLYFLIFKQQIK